MPKPKTARSALTTKQDQPQKTRARALTCPRVQSQSLRRRDLRQSNAPAPQPSDPQQPSLSMDCDPVSRERRPVHRPPIELHSRSERIDPLDQRPPRFEFVMALIEKHIRKSCACLSRRREHVCMIPICEDATTPFPKRIEHTRHADLERRRAAREVHRISCFHDEMKVIGEHRKVHKSKAISMARCFQRLSNDEEGCSSLTKIRKIRHESEGEVHGMMPAEIRSSSMRVRRCSSSLPSCSFSFPSPHP